MRKNLILIAFLSLIVPPDLFAEKINLKKEINLFELSQKYPRCKNDQYRDDCYDISRGSDYLREGYWKKNKLWEGIYRDEIINKITHKYIDGIKVSKYLCEKNILSRGWYLCEGGEKYKPIRNGRFDQLNNKQGQFIIKWVNGDVYEGNYKDDAKHGYGKMTWAVVGDVYAGNWEDGVKHGYGKYTWASGGIYEGNYKDDAKHGYGKMTFSNGDVYEGNWYKGEMVDK